MDPVCFLSRGTIHAESGASHAAAYGANRPSNGQTPEGNPLYQAGSANPRGASGRGRLQFTGCSCGSFASRHFSIMASASSVTASRVWA